MACNAVAAGDQRVASDSGALCVQRRRAVHHGAAKLVAQYQARFATRIVAVVSVHVRAANSHRFDFHLAVKPPSIMMVCPVM